MFYRLAFLPFTKLAITAENAFQDKLCDSHLDEGAMIP